MVVASKVKPRRLAMTWGSHMQSETGVPFVARHRKLLAASSVAGPDHRYDRLHQLWRCARTGEALVVRHAARGGASLAPSEFGETTLTKTVEGVDQSEGRIDGGCISAESDPSTRPYGVVASEFGETCVTETGEGHDQSERTSGA